MSWRENVEKNEKVLITHGKFCAMRPCYWIRDSLVYVSDARNKSYDFEVPRWRCYMILHLTLCHHHSYGRYREAKGCNKFVGRLASIKIRLYSLYSALCIETWELTPHWILILPPLTISNKMGVSKTSFHWLPAYCRYIGFYTFATLGSLLSHWDLPSLHWVLLPSLHPHYTGFYPSVLGSTLTALGSTLAAFGLLSWYSLHCIALLCAYFSQTRIYESLLPVGLHL